MCLCLGVKWCDCGGGGCFGWGRKWQLRNSGSAMVSKERHDRNAGTGRHTTTCLHLPSYWNLPKLWPHRGRFHLCRKWHFSDSAYIPGQTDHVHVNLKFERYCNASGLGRNLQFLTLYLHTTSTKLLSH